MKDTAKSITMQELRRDPVGFLRQINSGKSVSVVYRSREFARVKSARPKHATQEPRGARYYLDLAEQSRKNSKTVLGPDRGVKELYSQTIAEKYAKKYGIR